MRLRREIESDCRKRLDALELVWKMARSPASGEVSARSSVGGAIGVGRMVSEAVDALDSPISVPAVERWIVARYPECRGMLKRPSLSQALKRLVEGGHLEVAERGVGKRPAVYRKPSGGLRDQDKH